MTGIRYSHLPALSDDGPSERQMKRYNRRLFARVAFLCWTTTVFTAGTIFSTKFFDSFSATSSSLTDETSTASKTSVPLLPISPPPMTGTEDVKYESDPNPGAPWPRMAWLMSFPNSGTSYTMMLTKRITKTKTGTNYGDEAKNKTSSSRLEPMFLESPQGPFWDANDPSPKPVSYVLTKTHCGGRCAHCEPANYIETLPSFEEWCHMAGTTRRDGNKVRRSYAPEYVQRAVHLVRDPLNNIVARFNLEYKEMHKKPNENAKWIAQYENNAIGFQKWCSSQVDRYRKQELLNRYLPLDVKKVTWNLTSRGENLIPCHSEFFRYVQWHNLANDVRHWRRLPTLMLHYEDYELDWEGNVDRLLSFLKLDRASNSNTTSNFIAGKNHHSYYSIEWTEKIWDFMKMIATPETWSYIQRYRYAN